MKKATVWRKGEMHNVIIMHEIGREGKVGNDKPGKLKLDSVCAAEGVHGHSTFLKVITSL